MKKREWFKLVVSVIGTLLLLAAFAIGTFGIWIKVRSEHGLDTYLTPEGVEFNYIGALILLALIPVSLLGGFEIRHWQLRDERDFKKKLESKSSSRCQLLKG